LEVKTSSINVSIIRLKGENMEINFTSKTMGSLLIKVIDKKEAKKLITNHHYSKKWNSNFGIINIGIFKNNNINCLGVASFGNMMNAKSYSKISDEIVQNQILELNRMWIDDCLGKNAETILISKSFKIIKSLMPNVKIIQSFADGRLGCGTIYKAANFKYYGFSKTIFFKDKYTGEFIHKMMFEKTSRPITMSSLCLKYVHNSFDIFEVKTHRYIYCLDKKMYKTIKLKEQPYPDYEKYIKPIDKQFSLNNMIKAMIILEYLGNIDGKNDLMEFIKNRFDTSEINIAIENCFENVHIKNFIHRNNNINK
jgi:hypothetical protein